MNQLLEAAEFTGDFILPGKEQGDFVIAGFVGFGCCSDACVGITDNDGGAGNRGSLRVENFAVNCGSGFLRIA